jgi:hypothetical protein
MTLAVSVEQKQFVGLEMNSAARVDHVRLFLTRRTFQADQRKIRIVYQTVLYVTKTLIIRRKLLKDLHEILTFYAQKRRELSASHVELSVLSCEEL